MNEPKAIEWMEFVEGTSIVPISISLERLACCNINNKHQVQKRIRKQISNLRQKHYKWNWFYIVKTHIY
jgi:hypothetical protein